MIGHLKSDGLLERNHLAGAAGDAINAVLAAAGHNLRLLLAWLRLLCAWLLAAPRARSAAATYGSRLPCPQAAPRRANG